MALVDHVLAMGLDLRVSEHRMLGQNIKLDVECIATGTLFSDTQFIIPERTLRDGTDSLLAWS